MGKSTRGSFTMRLISFGILLLVPTILADSFAGERVKVGKKTCTCDFTFVLNGDRVNVKSSMVSCDKKCSGGAKDVELGGDGMNLWLPEGLPRDGWSLSNGQYARLPCSNDHAIRPLTGQNGRPDGLLRWM